MSAARAWSSSASVKEFSTTFAPARASSQAIPRPMPEFDPVIMAVLPDRSVVRAMAGAPLFRVCRSIDAAHAKGRAKRARCLRRDAATGTGRKRHRRIFGNRQKKRRHKAGVELLRQVSYRQETYRAVTPL